LTFGPWPPGCKRPDPPPQCQLGFFDGSLKSGPRRSVMVGPIRLMDCSPLEFLFLSSFPSSYAPGFEGAFVLLSPSHLRRNPKVDLWPAEYSFLSRQFRKSPALSSPRRRNACSWYRVVIASVYRVGLGMFFRNAEM